MWHLWERKVYDQAAFYSNVINRNIRRILLLVLPIFLALWLFHPREILIELEKQGNYSSFTLPKYEDLERPKYNDISHLESLRYLIANIISTPFELKHYDLNITDISSYQGNLGCSFWNLTLDGIPYGIVDMGSSKIISFIPTETTHKFELAFTFQGIKQINCGSIYVNWKINAKTNTIDIVVKILLFIFAYWAIYFLLKEVVKEIKS